LGEITKPVTTNSQVESDIVIILHPDYQYNPRLITAMASMIANDVYDIIASRLLGVGALVGGMPIINT
jgi:hypothetical protein